MRIPYTRVKLSQLPQLAAFYFLLSLLSVGRSAVYLKRIYLATYLCYLTQRQYQNLTPPTYLAELGGKFDRAVTNKVVSRWVDLSFGY